MGSKRSLEEFGQQAAVSEAKGVEAVASSVAAVDIADIERLMDGFREEVQKLDEGLRMLSAYVAGLRKRASRGESDTLH
jgi:hypothetical protein